MLGSKYMANDNDPNPNKILSTLYIISLFNKNGVYACAVGNIKGDTPARVTQLEFAENGGRSVI